MKVKGNGQGKVLTAPELKGLFSDGLVSDRALFAICLFTGCRISEALALQVTDIKNKTITFRKSATKGKLKTRTIDIPMPLIKYLADYQPPINPYKGIGQKKTSHSEFPAILILKKKRDLVLYKNRELTLIRDNFWLNHEIIDMEGGENPYL